MNDDELLQALGARERDATLRRAPEWDAVATGRMSPEDAADRIRARGDADEDELALAMELFAPLSDGFDDALVDRLVEAAPSQAAEPSQPAEVVPITRRSWRRPTLAIGLVSAAAAAALLMIVMPPGSNEDSDPALAALPSFDMHLEPERATVRAGHAAEVPTVIAGDGLELLLRPASSHSVAARAWACLEREGTRREIALDVSEGAAGSTLVARAMIPADTATGPWTLVAVVASERPASEPCALSDAPTHRVMRAALRIDAPSHAP